jgi:glyoxylase-like metal-dependent hydrolase (beta-lactamase superfamily II)/8-oxo-dGTP pyrophosphatase MutT (NUDIX family)
MAASLLLVRDSAQGPQVLMMQRAAASDQYSRLWVFPGGVVDAQDRASHPHCLGLDDTSASVRLQLPQGGLDHVAAALRECFEEASILLAVDAHGQPVRPADHPEGTWEAWRAQVHNGQLTLAALCAQQGWRLAASELHHVAHWISPVGLPKRFDTRFFVAQAPVDQPARHDGTELDGHAWVHPAEAIAPGSPRMLMGPTRHLLTALARLDSAQAMLDWARGQTEVRCTQPRLARTAGGAIGPLHPSHPAWPELGLLDPHGAGLGSERIEPGRVVALQANWLRLTANNGNTMTGPGTNAYLLRTGPDNRWALIDPGPGDPAQVEALLAAAPGPVDWILVTHTHLDHSPAAAPLKARTGATVLGRIASYPQGQDPSFTPDRILHGGETLTLGPELTLQVLATPGHASNHLCYLWPQARVLFTGDHVMQGSTVVINPPDGDMAAYLASLQLIVDRAQEIDWIAPGHGFLMPDPGPACLALVQHRLRREARVAQALAQSGPATAPALLPVVYDDVPAARHPVALRSLLAHLLHLQHQGRARQDAQQRWVLVPNPQPSA